jgi:hypothetical protein
MGGKNQNAAKTSGAEISKSGSVQAPKKNSKTQKCKKGKKHWIGVRVEDENGKPVADVLTHAQLGDDEFSVIPEGYYRTQVIFDATTCEFSFPGLYDVDWWPKDGTKPNAFPAEQSVHLEEGDCVVSAAASAGFRDYHELWDCAANTDLKQASPNANQQTPGSAFQGPGKKTKTVEKAVDQAWVFVIRNKKPAQLRIVLIDRKGAPLDGKDWVFSKLAKTGITGSDGMIEVTGFRPALLMGDKLKVTLKPAATPPTPPVVQPTPAPPVPPYPPVIVPAEYKDKMPAPDYTEQLVEWDLKIGSLRPFSVHSGALQRLHNLGFGCDTDPGLGPTAKGEPEAIQAYVKMYQNKDATGMTWEDIKADLQTRHDNP